MSEKNVEVVRREMDATKRQDWNAALEELDPAVEIDDRDIVESGNYEGHDGFLKWLRDWGSSWDSWRIDDIELREAPDGAVVALLRMFVQGRGSGIELERDDAIVFALDGGKIKRIIYYNDQRQALEAAGLSE